MAYRRKQGISRASTFKEEVHYQDDNTFKEELSSSSQSSSSSTTSSSLAAQAIRASSAHRDSSLSSAYRESAFAFRDSDRQKSFPAARSTDAPSYEYTSTKTLNESKYSLWGVLAKKAKQILEDDNLAQQYNKPGKAGNQMLDIPSDNVFHQSHQSPESSRKTDNPSLQKRFDALTSSLSNIGGTIGKSFEEGLTMVRSADIIQETRKLQIRKKGSNMDTKTQVTDANNPEQQVQMQTNPEMQLKASRDVAMAMAAKAKLLLRELKTVKADLAFAKERCNQLEEENRILRESHDKGDRPEDDDLIRLQLETLLAEKARLANENSIYARENRFLREIVEYHQLTMQDVVYLDEGIEEVTEVYPITVPSETGTCPTLLGPPLPPLTISSEARTISSSLTSQSVAAAIPEAAKDIHIVAQPITPAVPKDAVSSSSFPGSATNI